MADSISSPQNTGIQQPTTSVTIVETEVDQGQEVATVRLRLRKPATDKKVQWSTETVDNEDMNKKKSKCCCIYTKPRSIDEDNTSSSSSDSEDECEHCKGHIKKKKTHHHHAHDHPEHVHQHNDETTEISINETGPSCSIENEESSKN